MTASASAVGAPSVRATRVAIPWTVGPSASSGTRCTTSWRRVPNRRPEGRSGSRGNSMVRTGAETPGGESSVSLADRRLVERVAPRARTSRAWVCQWVKAAMLRAASPPSSSWRSSWCLRPGGRGGGGATRAGVPPDDPRAPADLRMKPRGDGGGRSTLVGSRVERGVRAERRAAGGGFGRAPRGLQWVRHVPQRAVPWIGQAARPALGSAGADAGDDEEVAGPCGRHVGQPDPLRGVPFAFEARLLENVPRRQAHEPKGGEAATGVDVATCAAEGSGGARVGQHDDRKLEPLCGIGRHHAHARGSLLGA